MLFSSPDYPLFLLAVFFLYALARWGGPPLAWARFALMVLLADVIVMLVAKDLDVLWDPIGGPLLRFAATGEWAWSWRWLAGLAVIVGSIHVGRRYAAWIASDRGQRILARVVVGVLALVGSTVAIAWQNQVLDEVTAAIVAYAHLAILFVLGVGLGVSRTDEQRPLGRVVILFVASSLFYHAWAAAMPGPYRYLLALLLGTIALDYYLALWIEATEDPWARKALVVVSLCSNLGILVFFKYTDFFTQDVLHLPVRRLHLILPAGISFHTFQSLSYTIDVYRRQLRATRSVITFATFVLFFPQLVAGPIVRAQDLLPQLSDLPILELERATRGLFRIVIGLFKKIALADTLAIAIVDRVFDTPGHFTTIEVLAGVYGYAFQIYLDFSAYSDIAIGSAQVLGFELPENFRTPYRSVNLQEFWRRWHISLSTWLRDYLYISLGGSRGAEWRTYVNLSLTMLLGGLWHGANWTFVVWGGLHGFGLAITRFFQRTRDPRAMLQWCAGLAVIGIGLHFTLPPEALGTWGALALGWLTLTPLWAVATAWLSKVEWPKPGPEKRAFDVEMLRIGSCIAAVAMIVSLQYAEPTAWIPVTAVAWGLSIAADLTANGAPPVWTIVRRVLAGILTFHYVCFAWIFFRAPSFEAALAVLRQLGTWSPGHANVTPMVQTALAVGLATHLWADGTFRWLRDRFCALPPIAQGVLLAVVTLVLRELSHAKLVKFIYFEF